ncbi:MAG: hypothetical protein ACYTEZ_10415 [Planctomycetota bacterium]|jgi:hypothetical protein
MQTVVHVLATTRTSLREAIVNDKQLARHGFQVVIEKKPGRSRGWAKLRSLEEGHDGAVNIEWHGRSRMLVCRVVTRGRGRPHLTIGALMTYLLARHRGKIRAIHVVPP